MSFNKAYEITGFPRSNMMRFVLLLAGLIFISVICYYIINLIIIFPWLPSQLITVDNLEACDLIVILGGGSGYERVNYALHLLEQGYSKRVYAPYHANAESREYINSKLNQLSFSVIFNSEGKADSTYEEAINTKNYINRYGLTSIILVTSPYHSLRASWIFKKVMPKIKIVSAPCCLKSNSLAKKLQAYHKKEKRKFLFYYLLYAWRSFS